MEIKGYDAEMVRKIVAAVDSINPMNGIVTKFVDYVVADLLIKANFMWTDDDCDLYEDSALTEWRRRGGDVRDLARTLKLDIEISL